MFCSNCRHELKEQDNFCNNCGFLVSNNNQNKQNQQVSQSIQDKKPNIKKLFCCPKCNGTNIDLISTDKNMKTQKATSLNLNPLKPFTIFNHKEKQKEKKSAGKIGLGIMTGGISLLVTGTKKKKHCEYFCRNCGHRWIDK